MAEVKEVIPNPLPTSSTIYEGPSGDLTVVVDTMVQVLDALERIQQQLALMNEGENLKPGERHYG